jgi:hypothetical protein
MIRRFFKTIKLKKRKKGAKETDPDILSWKSVDIGRYSSRMVLHVDMLSARLNNVRFCNMILKKIQIEEESKVLNKNRIKIGKIFDIFICFFFFKIITRNLKFKLYKRKLESRIN